MDTNERQEMLDRLGLADQFAALDRRFFELETSFDADDQLKA